MKEYTVEVTCWCCGYDYESCISEMNITTTCQDCGAITWICFPEGKIENESN